MHYRRAFTLVELLVVVAIIGVLIALLMPAIQAARESARRVTCSNQLRQLAVAMLHHHETHGHLPSGGWGYEWVGIPDLGFGRKQPGSWIFNTLPFFEQQACHDHGHGFDGELRQTANAQRLATPIVILNCPSRRSAVAYPTLESPVHLRNPRETATVMAVARSDYAANAGDRSFSFSAGPATIAEGLAGTFSWPDPNKFSGICYPRSEVRLAQVADGATNTFLIGEKYLQPDAYTNGTDSGDNESMYNGYCTDLVRFALNVPSPDTIGISRPQRFGGPHPGGCLIAHCDASVQLVAYSISFEAFRSGANRRDSNGP
jgi:prepilin-type N-terminal cleavage/methylation domain-containing protein